MNHLIKVVGLDPSLRNWGWSIGELNLHTGELKIKQVGVINPDVPEGKQVRQNSKDLASSFDLYTGAAEVMRDSFMTFVEVPIGSQSARAMASYGICVGVLGALRAESLHFYEVTPTEVKLATGLPKTATKDQMIDWAIQQHPEANWPTYKEAGLQVISKAKAEHCADATAAIHAGLRSPHVQQMIQLLKRST